MNIDEEAKQIKVTGSKSIEARKKMNFMARYSLSVTILGTFIFLIWLLFFPLPIRWRDYWKQLHFHNQMF